MVARDNFNAGENLRLRWSGLRRRINALSNYVFKVEDLRTGDLKEIHGSRLKLYHDSSLYTAAVMSHVLCLEKGMVVQGLLGLTD